MRKWLLIGMTLSLVGCAGELETGYKPRKLGASETQRRGFYARPFTPEAQAARMERDQEVDMRRPRPGY